MIEINLLEEKKTLKMPTVLGLNLNDFNWKGLILAFLVFYGLDSYLNTTWQEELAVVDQEVTALQSELRRIRKDLRKNRDVKEKLEAYKRQIEKLKERSVQVDKIVRTKTNPKYLLEKLSRSMSEDIWLDSFSVDANRQAIIKGAATSYKAIGDFIIVANESPFFGKTLKLTTSSTSEEILDGIKVRLERFEVKGRVETYNPFNQ